MAKSVKVVEIRGGFWSGTLRPEQLQKVIADLEAQGFEYKNCQDVIGRRCGCLPIQVLWVIFEK